MRHPISTVTGTGMLIRLILRRDRVALGVWILLALWGLLFYAVGTADLYPTSELQRAYAAELDDPATTGLLGPLFAPTLGGLIAWRAGMQGIIIMGLASLLLVIRHTRAEEEAGRRELLASGVIGRHAHLTAALTVVGATNLLIALLLTVLLSAALASHDLPVTGWVALSLSWAATGWMLAALAAVAAQVAQATRAGRSVALLAFAGASGIMVAGNAAYASGTTWLAWLSPLAWTRLTRPFAGEQWWVFALVIALVAALVAAAYRLNARRDVGAGLLAARSGPASAAPGLRSPLALGWRMHRGQLAGWAAGFAAAGGVLGAVGQTITGALGDTELAAWFADWGYQDSGEAFVAALIFAFGGFVVAAYAIQATLRLRAEEVTQRADPLLATPASRLEWAASHLVFAGAGPAVILAALGLATGLGYGLGVGDLGGELSRWLGASLRMLPAVWVLAALAAALYGFAPRLAAPATWAVMVVLILLEVAWEFQIASQTWFNLSPFAHVHYSIREVGVTPLAWLAGLAAALTVTGLAALQRRDIA